MKTFTVPIFLGVNAEDKADALAKVCDFLDETLYDLNSETFPYCDVGLDAEIIEQEIQS